MKILVFNILAIVISICSYSQERDILIESDSIQNRNEPVWVFPLEKQAKFPGGMDSLNCLIESKLDNKIINSYKTDGRIIIQYTIDSLGKIQDIEINPDQIVKLATHLNFVTDKRIISQIYNSFKDLPNWEPSSIDGKNVKSRWTQVIKFPYKYKCQKD
jgi:hypothetical protein